MSSEGCPVVRPCVIPDVVSTMNLRDHEYRSPRSARVSRRRASLEELDRETRLPARPVTVKTAGTEE